jgi:hypothetical protein
MNGCTCLRPRAISGVSIANSFASIILGGFAPFIATWLILETSSPIAPFYYVMFTCLVSGIIIFKLPETADKDLGWMVFRLPKGRADGSAGFACASGLKQEPGASLSLVDPVFQQACSGHVAVLVA